MNDRTRRANFRNLIVILMIFTLSAIAAEIMYFSAQIRAAKQEKQDDLYHIAELKVSQIVAWRKERAADAATMLTSFLSNEQFRSIMSARGQSARKGQFLTWSRNINMNDEYKYIYLFDRRLSEIASLNADKDTPGDYALAQAGESLKENRVIFSDLHRNEKTGAVDLDILIPLVMSPGKEPSGALLLRIDPRKYLYPYIQSVPTKSYSFETLLFREENGRVLFLNDLRHRANSALSFSLPANREKLPAAMAVQGKEGVVEGIDYRGVPVLAAIKKIPESTWFLIAKIDKSEVYAPVRNYMWSAFITAIGFIIAAAFGVGFLWYKQAAELYRREYDLEVERKALRKHFDYLFQYANDIIMLFNDKLDIVEANEAAESAYGYTQEELLGKNLKDLRAENSLPGIAEIMSDLGKHGKLLFETVHKRKDGKTFPVEVSVRVMVIEWKEFYQAIIRDVSARKKQP